MHFRYARCGAYGKRAPLRLMVLVICFATILRNYTSGIEPPPFCALTLTVFTCFCPGGERERGASKEIQ